MLRIVKAELYKLFKSRTFKVLCGVVVLMSMLTTFFISPLFEKMISDSMEDMSPEEKKIILEQMEENKESEQIVTPGIIGFNLNLHNPTAMEVYYASFGSGFIEILVGVLIASILAKEYSQGTIKNTLAYGRRRYEFYIAKFLALVIGTTIITTILNLLSIVGACIVLGWGQPFEISQIFEMIKTFVASVFANSAVVSLIMIFAILVKSNGATIAITVGVFSVLPSFAATLYGVYPWYDKIYELTPFYNSALATSINSSNGDVLRSIIVAAVTIIIALLIGTRIFKTQDIK